MPEEEKPVGETPTPQPEGEKPKDARPNTDGGTQDFEAWLATQGDEVKALYEKHTGSLKSALDKERKANKKRDDEQARKDQEARDAQLSEVEKANKKLTALQEERDALAQQVRLFNAEKALLIAAEKEKIEFASTQAQRDAFDIALKAAEFDEEGNLSNAAALLRNSVKERDYLLKKQAQQPPKDTSATKRGPSTTPVVDEAYEAGLKSRYHIK